MPVLALLVLVSAWRRSSAAVEAVFLVVFAGPGTAMFPACGRFVSALAVCLLSLGAMSAHPVVLALPRFLVCPALFGPVCFLGTALTARTGTWTMALAVAWLVIHVSVLVLVLRTVTRRVARSSAEEGRKEKEPTESDHGGAGNQHTGCMVTHYPPVRSIARTAAYCTMCMLLSLYVDVVAVAVLMMLLVMTRILALMIVLMVLVLMMVTTLCSTLITDRRSAGLNVLVITVDTVTLLRMMCALSVVPSPYLLLVRATAVLVPTVLA